MNDKLNLTTFPKLEKYIVFENDKYLKRIVTCFEGMITANPIEILYPFVLKEYFTQELIDVYCQRIIWLFSNVLKKLLVYGFVSFRFNPSDVESIKLINYENGSLKYRVNKKSKELEFFWSWQLPNNNQFQNGIFDIGDNGSFLRNDSYEKNVNTFVINPPSFNGKINSFMKEFVDDKHNLDVIEKTVFKLEQLKAHPQFWVKRNMPNLNNVDNLFAYGQTMGTNRFGERERGRPNDLMDINKNFLPFMDSFNQRKLEEMLDLYNKSNFYSIHKVNDANTFGELIEPKFLDFGEKSDYFDKKNDAYKNDMYQTFGMFQNNSRSRLKDDSRQNNFFFRPVSTKIQKFMERAFSEMLNAVFCKEMKKLQPENVNPIRVKFDRIECLNEKEIEMLMESPGICVEAILAVVLGEEVIDLIGNHNQRYIDSNDSGGGGLVGSTSSNDNNDDDKMDTTP
jgi:hypothetical protein